jgi:hypothetical protein
MCEQSREDELLELDLDSEIESDPSCELEHPLEKLEQYIGSVMWTLERLTDERSVQNLREAERFMEYVQRLRADYNVVNSLAKWQNRERENEVTEEEWNARASRVLSQLEAEGASEQEISDTRNRIAEFIALQKEWNRLERKALDEHNSRLEEQE